MLRAAENMNVRVLEKEDSTLVVELQEAVERFEI
jgi:hypothetical protein